MNRPKLILFWNISSFFIDENYNIHIRQAQQTPALPTTRFSRSVFKRFVTSVDQPYMAVAHLYGLWYLFSNVQISENVNRATKVQKVSSDGGIG